jgi:hypothetical protein
MSALHEGLANKRQPGGLLKVSLKVMEGKNRQ